MQVARVTCENCDEGVLKAVESSGELIGYQCPRSSKFSEGIGCNVLVKPDEYETLLEEQADTELAVELASQESAGVLVKSPQVNAQPQMAEEVVVKRAAILPSLSVKGAETTQRFRRPFKAPVQDMSKVKSLGIAPRKRGRLGVRRWKRINDGSFFKARQNLPEPIALPDPVNLPVPPPAPYIPPPPPPAPVIQTQPPEQRLVLWEPTPEELTADPSLHTIEVEPLLTKWLRPHQREGVQFLTECILSQRDFEGAGAILADDMGLGKTLQSITLLYTLLRQGFQKGKPIVKRCVVICPVSLVSNWKSEFDKFVGVPGGVNSVAITEPTRAKVEAGIRDYLNPHTKSNTLIISYDCYRRHAEKFVGEGACDLLIADEAHRLKNAKTSTYAALNSNPCKRRLLLSGTPLQNDLDEFFAMVNFTNPNVLGDRKAFKSYYELPILTGREPDAAEFETKEGLERSNELSAIVNQFILRRTNVLLSKHLPPKVTQIVCCKMTPLQEKLYRHLIGCKEIRTVLADGRKSKQVLPLMNNLKQLANHPKLVLDGLERSKKSGKKTGGGFQGCEKLFPPEFLKNPCHPMYSGKLQALDRLLCEVRAKTDDRWVLVSNYTQTLDLLVALANMRGWEYVRLDGSVSIKKRKQMVDKLGDRKNKLYLFLLSSKAGGCGLNLVGANRLVLFDPDWNPAVDKQAAARVWRDGQKKRCFTYRFLATGTIEEKVYQRQLAKEGLQGVLGGAAQDAQVSSEELRRLFTYSGEDTLSDTHDTVECDCCDSLDAENEEPNVPQAVTQAPRSSYLRGQRGYPSEEDLINWAHHSSTASTPDFHFRNSHQPKLGCPALPNYVSFIFSCEVTGKPVFGPAEELAKSITCLCDLPPTVKEEGAAREVMTAKDAQAKLASHMAATRSKGSRRRRGGGGDTDSDDDGDGFVVESRRSSRSRKAPNRFTGQQQKEQWESLGEGSPDAASAALIASMMEEEQAGRTRTTRNAKRKEVDKNSSSQSPKKRPSPQHDSGDDDDDVIIIDDVKDSDSANEVNLNEEEESSDKSSEDSSSSESESSETSENQGPALDNSDGDFE